MSALDQRLERGQPPDDFRKAFVLATQTALALLRGTEKNPAFPPPGNLIVAH